LVVRHDLKTLSDLLDEALDLDEVETQALLARIEQTQPSLAPTLRKLLGYRTKLDSDELLTLNGHVFRPQTAARWAEDNRWSRSSASALEPGASALEPGAWVGAYRLERCLGEGGIASVWLATRNDETLKRTVALKLLHAWRYTRDVVERFRRERDILAQLSHPRIARLFDAGVTDFGLPWIALEYVDGEHITVYADRCKLSIAARVKLMIDVMDAVQYAHQNFVVHRDIKPSNVMVDAEGRVRLLDFGIAKLIRSDGVDPMGDGDTELTELAGRMLTLRYAAPEQIEGGAITAATDVFALGLLLAELLTGTFARVASKDPVQARAILDATIVRPSNAQADMDALRARGKTTLSQLHAELRGDLDTIILKSLARDPARRYATVSAFADDLTAYLQRRPIRARTPSIAYRVSMFFSRHRRVTVVAGALVLVSSIAALTSFRNYEALQQQRARTERLQGFMASLFLESDPSARQPEQALTAKQLLDRGRERADAQYADQPAFRGEILGQIASVYLRIGETAAGIETLRDAISLLQANVANDEPALNKARAQLGGLLLPSNERERGIELLEGVLRDCANERAACSDARGDAHLMLAHDPLLGIDRNLDHIANAISLYGKVRAPDSLEMLQAFITAADLERSKGDLQSAKQMLAEAEQIAAKNPPKGKEFSRLHNTRAAVALDDGDFALAAKTLDQLISWELFETAGRERGSILLFRTRIALMQGQIDEALVISQRARKFMDRSQMLIPYALIDFYDARAHAIVARHDLARKHIEDGWATFKSAGVNESSELWHFARRVEAETLARAGDLSNAQRLLSDSVRGMRAANVANYQYLIHALDALGAVSTANGSTEAAIGLHREEMEILDRHVRADHPLRLRAALQLSLATRAAAGISSGGSKALAERLLRYLPSNSQYRENLLSIAAGTFASSQLFLLF
jgi:serine/threonine protein kinase